MRLLHILEYYSPTELIKTRKLLQVLSALYGQHEIEIALACIMQTFGLRGER